MTEPITFTVIDPDAESGEWGSVEDPSPYFGLTPDKLTLSTTRLQNKFDVVIDKPRIRVVFDYPLRESHTLELIPLFGEPNFTRIGLAKAIAIKYQQIYDEEEKTSTMPEESVYERNKRLASELPEDTVAQRVRKRRELENAGMYRLANRASTNGKWGVWGHVLSDLDLHSVTYVPEKDVYVLGIDS